MKKNLIKVEDFNAEMNGSNNGESIITELRRLLNRDKFDVDYGVDAQNPMPLGGTWVGWT